MAIGSWVVVPMNDFGGTIQSVYVNGPEFGSRESALAYASWLNNFAGKASAFLPFDVMEITGDYDALLRRVPICVG